jgi:hypothetical protein
MDAKRGSLNAKPIPGNSCTSEPTFLHRATSIVRVQIFCSACWLNATTVCDERHITDVTRITKVKFNTPSAPEPSDSGW